MNRRTLTVLFSVAGGLLLLFVLLPLAATLISTSPAELGEALGDPEVGNSLALTLTASAIATVLVMVTGIPLAYLLARRRFPGRRLVESLIDLPIVIPHSAAGIAILGVISRNTVLGRMGSAIGLDFVGAPAGIALAMAFVSLPFLINAARDGFASVPVRYEQAAATLGASPARIFFTISLPLAYRSIISGLVMMFARGMSEVGAVVVVAYHPMVTPTLIWDRFSSFGLHYARPVAVLFILVTLATFVLLRIFSNNRKNA